MGARDTTHGLISRLRAEAALLDDGNVGTWANFKGCQASDYQLAVESPWSCMRSNTEAMQGLEQAEI